MSIRTVALLGRTARCAARVVPRAASMQAATTTPLTLKATRPATFNILRTSTPLFNQNSSNPDAFKDIATHVQVEEMKAGSSTKPTVGKQVAVHYTGRFTDGKVFDSSVSRGQPLTFLLGGGQVIRGWDEVVSRMTKGQQVKATISPDWAYGRGGAGGVIPPNATLVFEMELVDCQ